MKPALTSSILYGLLAMSGWGTTNFFIASLSKKIGAFKTAFLIQVFAIFPTLLLFPIFKKDFILDQNFLLLSFLGVLGSIAYISLLKGYEEGAVSVIAPLTSFWAVILAILSFMFLKEAIFASKLIGMAIAILGVILISTDFQKIFKEKKVKIYAGVKWAGLTALIWGVEFFFVALFSRKLGWYTASIGLRFWSAIAFLVLVVLLKKRPSFLLKEIPKLIWLVILLDVFTITAYNIGLVKGEPGVVSIIGGACPLVTVILAAIFLKEKLYLVQKIGILLILAGVASLSLV